VLGRVGEGVSRCVCGEGVMPIEVSVLCSVFCAWFVVMS
jgi:hypothetical protein